ncbi:MAG: hypothetical protein KatS3mg111_0530 [Pirellulaceae bacterium]|nr:MAG: hypothetical protein KatS3mg111_0530 [Pirellulaceae bacterium]
MPSTASRPVLRMSRITGWQPLVAAIALLIVPLGNLEIGAAQEARTAAQGPTAQDHAIVQALMLLPEGTLERFPNHRLAVLRYLESVAGSEEYLRIADRLNVLEQVDILRRMVQATPVTTRNVDAARLLLRAGRVDAIREAMNSADQEAAQAMCQALGHLGSPDAVELLKEALENSSSPRWLRIAATSALGRSNRGQQYLLQLARQGQLPDEVRFAASNALLSSNNERIRTEASALLHPPATSEAEPLPPVRELAQRRGSASRGQTVFRQDGTCIKCHQVRGEGKSIGPDLSEIGSKLSREDMFVAILDPSAAISHNYETYTVLDADGRVVTGLMINRTDEVITIRDSEGIDHSFPVEDIEDLKQQSTSLMPADLQKSMSLQQLVDLVEYMLTLRKPDEARGRAAAAARPAVPIQVDHEDPEAEIKTFEVAAGVTVELFAAEPMIRNPTAIDVDSQGRVWVCEAVNYRHFRNTDAPVRTEGDRIVVLQDRDGDGKADHSTVFYQSREIDSPHGVCVSGNRVIVSAGENVFVFTDEDGDLVADKKETLFTGISGVQHDHGIHTFNIGPDGRLYFNFGNEGRQLKQRDGSPVVDLAGNTVKDDRHPYQQGMVFRCDMDGRRVETLGWNFRNNWEVCLDSFGNLWQSDNDDDGNQGTRINFVMEFGNYGYRDELTGASWQTPRIGMHEEIPKRHWHVNDPGVVPNLLQTGAGSPTGICFYEGDLLPAPFRNQLLHCDPGPNVVRAYPVEPDGAGYRAAIRNLLKGVGDSWFRPVDVCAAPDGSLLIADWYDPGVGGHRMGDPTHGRLFRLVPTGHQGYAIPRHDFDTPEGAARALLSPNLATQFLAQQALRGMGARAAGALQSVRDASDNPRHQARAAWQLAIVTNDPASQIRWLITQRDENLRIVGIRIAKQHGLDVVPIVEQLIDDSSSHVRRELLIALRHVDDPRAADLWAALATQHHAGDRWYLEALGIAADGKWDTYLDAWLNRTGDTWNTPAGHDIVWRSRSSQTPRLLLQLIKQCSTPTEQYRYFRALDFQDPRQRESALTDFLHAASP